jgi:hypothetical protein
MRHRTPRIWDPAGSPDGQLEQYYDAMPARHVLWCRQALLARVCLATGEDSAMAWSHALYGSGDYASEIDVLGIRDEDGMRARWRGRVDRYLDVLRRYPLRQEPAPTPTMDDGVIA